MRNNQFRQQNELAKATITASATMSATPFKTAFKATLGFYAAQFLVGLAQLGFFALICLIIGLIGKYVMT